MFGFSPKLPIRDEERLWTNERFKRLEKLLGRVATVAHELCHVPLLGEKLMSPKTRTANRPRAVDAFQPRLSVA